MAFKASTQETKAEATSSNSPYSTTAHQTNDNLRSSASISALEKNTGRPAIFTNRSATILPIAERVALEDVICLAHSKIRSNGKTSTTHSISPTSSILARQNSSNDSSTTRKKKRSFISTRSVASSIASVFKRAIKVRTIKRSADINDEKSSSPLWGVISNPDFDIDGKTRYERQRSTSYTCKIANQVGGQLKIGTSLTKGDSFIALPSSATLRNATNRRLFSRMTFESISSVVNTVDTITYSSDESFGRAESWVEQHRRNVNPDNYETPVSLSSTSFSVNLINEHGDFSDSDSVASYHTCRTYFSDSANNDDCNTQEEPGTSDYQPHSQ